MKKQIEISDYNLGTYVIPNECINDVCVDIGANVGCFTIENALRFKTLHYYEPFDECFSIVKEKTKALENIIGWNEAVYKEDGVELSMVPHANMHAGSNAILTDALNDEWSEDVLQKVTTVSLPTILRRVGGHINYLKVDCETSEYYFLMGQDLSEIDYIGIELHHQIPIDKYKHLVRWILRTHSTNDNCEYSSNNKEVLFTNKKLYK